MQVSSLQRQAEGKTSKERQVKNAVRTKGCESHHCSRLKDMVRAESNF